MCVRQRSAGNGVCVLGAGGGRWRRAQAALAHLSLLSAGTNQHQSLNPRTWTPLPCSGTLLCPHVGRWAAPPQPVPWVGPGPRPHARDHLLVGLLMLVGAALAGGELRRRRAAANGCLGAGAALPCALLGGAAAGGAASKKGGLVEKGIFCRQGARGVHPRRVGAWPPHHLLPRPLHPTSLTGRHMHGGCQQDPSPTPHPPQRLGDAAELCWEMLGGARLLPEPWSVPLLIG